MAWAELAVPTVPIVPYCLSFPIATWMSAGYWQQSPVNPINPINAVPPVCRSLIPGTQPFPPSGTTPGWMGCVAAPPASRGRAGSPEPCSDPAQTPPGSCPDPARTLPGPCLYPCLALPEEIQECPQTLGFRGACPAAGVGFTPVSSPALGSFPVCPLELCLGSLIMENTGGLCRSCINNAWCFPPPPNPKLQLGLGAELALGQEQSLDWEVQPGGGGGGE